MRFAPDPKRTFAPKEKVPVHTRRDKGELPKPSIADLVEDC